MDAAVADTINRLDAQRIAARLDRLDQVTDDELPWYRRTAASQMLAERNSSVSAWLLGAWAFQTPGIAFDGAPADCDWDNLFSHFRAEIQKRRDTDASTSQTAETRRTCVV